MKLRTVTFAAASVLCLSAQALTLGAGRGTVVLGAPIDLSFDVVPDAGASLASSCIAARLVSGDAPIDPSRVRVVPLPSIAGRPPSVRVQAFVRADDPVLTARITAGCTGPVSRIYTFLAQPPEGAAGPVPVDVARLSSDLPAASAFAAPAARPAPPAQNVAVAIPTPPQQTEAPPAAAPAPRKAAPRPAAKLPERPRHMHTAAPVGQAPVAEPVRAPQAPPTVAPPAEVPAVMPVQAASQSVAALSPQPQPPAAPKPMPTPALQPTPAPEDDGFPGTLAYGLAAALALGLAALIWRRKRRAAAAPDWADSAIMVPVEDDVPDASGSAHAPLMPHPDDVWLESVPGSVAKPVPVPAVASARSTQIVHPEELFDIVERAEFFISVGEHDQAISVLKDHIADKGANSPTAYLELLRLYHQLGRAQDFNALRASFLRHFNATLPDFAHFREQGKGLEHYVDMLAEIEAQWTSPAVLPLLENAMFLHEGQPPGAPPFDPAAYDDLLMLLAIAQTTPASERGAPPPRERTTPYAPPAEISVADIERHEEDWGGQAGSTNPGLLTARSLDSLMGGLASAAPAPAGAPGAAMLDLDLSAPAPLTGGAQPAGFDAGKQEWRFELESPTTKG
ncbi:MAG: hypothetical protein QM740_18790 [Acidovorax sp.]